jgi:hypothetical protein
MIKRTLKLILNLITKKPNKSAQRNTRDGVNGERRWDTGNGQLAHPKTVVFFPDEFRKRWMLLLLLVVVGLLDGQSVANTTAGHPLFLFFLN